MRECHDDEFREAGWDEFLNKVSSEIKRIPKTLAHGLTVAAGWGAFISGPVAIYLMYRIYRIPARPYTVETIQPLRH